MRTSLLGTLCLLALAVAAPHADATTIRRLTTAEMVATADVIVLGQQVESRSVWVGRMLVTRVTVSVHERLKGRADSTVTVDIPGGIDVNRKIPIGMTVPGAPRIYSGERVLLFLSQRAAFTAHAGSSEQGIVGFSQGKFSVVEDADGRPMVVGGIGHSAVRPLAELKAEIESHLSGRTAAAQSSRRGLRVVGGD